MARQEGLEPPTYCLEGSCSIQLSYWRISMERVTGIGPAYPAWKAGVLPLNYTRKSLPLAVSARAFYHRAPELSTEIFQNPGNFFVNYVCHRTVGAFTHVFIPIGDFSVGRGIGIVRVYHHRQVVVRVADAHQDFPT